MHCFAKARLIFGIHLWELLTPNSSSMDFMSTHNWLDTFEVFWDEMMPTGRQIQLLTKTTVLTLDISHIKTEGVYQLETVAASMTSIFSATSDESVRPQILGLSPWVTLNNDAFLTLSVWITLMMTSVLIKRHADWYHGKHREETTSFYTNTRL